MRDRVAALARSSPLRRIAFPFTGATLSDPALGAALRVAHAEGATLVPVYLALVPLDLALEVPLRAECEAALPLLEAIEHRAARAGVAVDSRIERGRSVRHALGMLMQHERFERMVVAAAADRQRRRPCRRGRRLAADERAVRGLRAASRARRAVPASPVARARPAAANGARANTAADLL